MTMHDLTGPQQEPRGFLHQGPLYRYALYWALWFPS